jgi:hypothetical protein
MMSVGAVPWSDPTTLEGYSSQGPASDGRIKPDIVGPDCTSGAAYGAGAFCGTSAASPHVAGAAALVKQAYPSYTNAQIRTFLEGRAVDLGTVGKDNQFGAGRLNMGAADAPTANLVERVSLQGRASPTPHTSYVITAQVQLASAGALVYSNTLQTSSNGVFTATSIVPGSYDLCVKGSHTLREKTPITLTTGVNLGTIGPLREGDASGDNCVTVLDFSVLRTSFGACVGASGFDPRTDFNQDGCTTIQDFSLLRQNFSSCGATCP